MKELSTEKEVTVSGQKALEIADILTATNLRILKLIRSEPLYISTLSNRLALSEAYISEQIKVLEKLGMVSVMYQTGDRGVRKVCRSAIEKITIIIKDEEPASSDSTEEKSA